MLLIKTLIGYYKGKTLVAICGTDAALSAFLQSEHWRSAALPVDRELEEATIENGAETMENGSENDRTRRRKR